MNPKIIYIIAGVIVLGFAGYAIEQVQWNYYPVSGGQSLTADMLNMLFSNLKNLTDVMHSDGDGNLVVSGKRITLGQPVDGNDLATVDYVNAQGAEGGCYISYYGGCLSGFNLEGSIGKWGHCYVSDREYFLPPGAHCGNPWIEYLVSDAYLCCR